MSSTGGRVTTQNRLIRGPESILPYANDTAFLNVKTGVRDFYTDEKFRPATHDKFQDRHDYRLQNVALRQEELNRRINEDGIQTSKLLDQIKQSVSHVVHRKNLQNELEVIKNHKTRPCWQINSKTGSCQDTDDEFKAMMSRVNNLNEKRREDYSMCNNLFNIQDEYFKKNQRKHLNIQGAIKTPKQLRQAIDINNPATFQEYMLGEGQDYSQMILNLENAGKLGSKQDLAKYPLYNTLKGIVDEKNYQRAKVFEFKEVSKKNKLTLKEQEARIAKAKAKFQERLTQNKLNGDDHSGTVTSLGHVQSLEQNILQQGETSRLLEDMESVPEEEDGLEVQVVRFLEDEHDGDSKNNSKIQIEFGDEEEWTSQAFPFTETERNAPEEDESELQIVSMNRFTEGKKKDRQRDTDQGESTKRSDFIRCTVNQFQKMDHVNQNVDNFMSRSKGTASSEDYTLRSLRRNQYSGETIGILNLGDATFEQSVIVEESDENLRSVENLDDKNVENNFDDQDVTEGKYFKVVKSKINRNNNFMATGATMTSGQLEFLKNTLEKSKNGSQLSKEDLDQVELLNLQFLKDQMEQKMNQLDSLNELEQKKIAINQRNLMELSLKQHNLSRGNFMVGESVDSVQFLKKKSAPQYIHEPSLSFAGSHERIQTLNTPSFNPLSNQLSTQKPVEIKEFSYNPEHKMSFMDHQPIHEESTRQSYYSQNTMTQSNGSHGQLLDEMRLYSDLNIQANLIDSVYSGGDQSQRQSTRGGLNSGRGTHRSDIYVAENLELPLHERLSIGAQTDVSSREHSLLMGKIHSALTYN